MNFKEAKWLYKQAVDDVQDSYFYEHDWNCILDEMNGVVNAKTDFAAGRTIDWWGCWDRKFTATAMARKIREVWKNKSKGI